MKKESAKQKTQELINELAKRMSNNIDHALSCGAIDLDNYEDNYELPKIILAALLYNETDRLNMPAWMKVEANNLYTCM